jgi:hypothetical protein
MDRSSRCSLRTLIDASVAGVQLLGLPDHWAYVPARQEPFADRGWPATQNQVRLRVQEEAGHRPRMQIHGQGLKHVWEIRNGPFTRELPIRECRASANCVCVQPKLGPLPDQRSGDTAGADLSVPAAAQPGAAVVLTSGTPVPRKQTRMTSSVPDPEAPKPSMMDSFFQLCWDTGLEGIRFSSESWDGHQWIAVEAATDGSTGAMHVLKMWHGPNPDLPGTPEPDPTDPESMEQYLAGMTTDFSYWIEINGRAADYLAFIDDPGLLVPGLGEEEARSLVDAAANLQEVHRTGAAVANLMLSGAMSAVCQDLNDTIAGGGPEDTDLDYMLDHLPGHRDGNHDHADEYEEDLDNWQEALAFFDELCQTPVLSGVVLERSPRLLQAIDVSADSFGLDGDQVQRLRIFWDTGTDGSAVHWIDVGGQRIEAHGEVDLDNSLPHLSLEARAEVAHILEHLHQLVHVAEDVAAMHREELAEHLQDGIDHADAVKVIREADEDLLALMNATARLHTGRPVNL